MSGLVDEIPYRVTFRKEECIDQLEHLPYLFSIDRYQNYKSKVRSKTLADVWYDQLSDPFPIHYLPTAPNKLSGVDGFKGFDREHFDIPSDLLRESTSHLQRLLLPVGRCDPLTDEEVLVNMVKTTVPGLPFRLLRKKDYFLKMPVIQELIKLRCGENQLNFLWKMVQKHELRHLDKLRDNKIRSFCVSPIDHCFAQSKFFTNFNERLYDLGSDPRFPLAVGMSKYYRGFHNIAVRLLKFSKLYFADFSGFDTTITPQMMYNNLKLKLPHMNITRDEFCLIWDIVNSAIYTPSCLENGDVFLTNGGNPSGQTNTIVDNTIINYLLFMCCLVENCKKQNIKFSIEWYDENIYAQFFGDDSIFGVSDEVDKWFNLPVWRDWCKQYGFNLKGNDTPVTIEECEFLSHKFKLIDGTYLPVPDTDKMLASLVLGADQSHPLYVLMRAMSLRVETWTNVEVRSRVSDFISFVFSQYDWKLQGSYELAPGFTDLDGKVFEPQVITRESILNIYFTDDEIFNLYTGYEGVFSGESLNKFSRFKKYCDLFKIGINFLF